MSYRFVTIFLCGSFLFLKLFSQSKIYADKYTRFDNFTAEQGLSTSTVLDIIQDKYGFLWIATPNGLNRFDGYHFLHFYSEAGDSCSLSDSYITCFAEDAWGNLWIGTKNGLNRLNRDTFCFSTLYHEPGNNNSLKDSYIRALYADDSGKLFIETRDGYLSVLDIAEGRFTHYKHKRLVQEYYDYHSIYQDKEGLIWFGGRNIGPFFLNPENNQVHLIKADSGDPHKKRENDISCFFEDSHGNFWMSGLDGAYKYYTKEDRFEKLLASSTFSITEDHDKNVWFGSGNGVFCLRDSVMYHYTYSISNPKSLVNNHVNKIYVDRCNNVWLGTQEGLSKFSPNKYKFKTYRHLFGDDKSLSNNHVTDILEDSRRQIWISTMGGGLNQFDPETEIFTPFRHNPSNKYSITSDMVSCLYLDEQQTLWVGLWSGRGFNKFLPGENRFVRYVYDPKTLKRDWYNDFVVDKNGVFWAGMWGANGMTAFDRETGRFTHTHFSKKNKPIGMRVNALCCDENSGNIWIGGSQLYAFSSHTAKSTRLVPANNSFLGEDTEQYKYLRGISFNEINKIYQAGNFFFVFHADGSFVCETGINKCVDLPLFEKGSIENIFPASDKNNHWILSRSSLYKTTITDKIQLVDTLAVNTDHITGLAEVKENIYYSSADSLFIYAKKSRKQRAMVFNSNITCLQTDDYNRLWAGTSKGLYLVEDAAVTDSIKYSKSKKSIQSNQINCLLSLPGRLVIGTDNGLTILDTEIRDTITYLPDATHPNALINGNILSLCMLGDELLAGTDNGVCRFSFTDRKFYDLVNYDPNEMSSHLINCLFEDSEKNIWVGTSNNGLNLYYPDKGTIDHFIEKTYDDTSFWGSNVSCVFETSDKKIVVASKGLNIYNRGSKSFSHITTANGLPTNNIYSIQEDNSQNLWLGSDAGLIVYNLKNGLQKIYTQGDGLLTSEFTQASCKLHSGKLMFGGKQGFYIFNPDNDEPNKVKPMVELTGLTVFDSVYYHDLTRHEKVTLSHKENFITFQFSSLDFTSVEKNMYRYKLCGLDVDWRQTRENKAVYTGLAPGKYEFLFCGSNNDGVWSDENSLELYIRPSFWQTVWFKISLVLLLFAVVASITVVYIKKIKMQNLALQLEQRLLRSQMNPHFLFNSLTAIQSFFWDNNSKGAAKYIAKFARLMRLVLENSRNEYVTLDKEIETLVNYLDMQQLRFRNTFEYTLSVDPLIDPESIAIPPMLTQPFIENAIEHGILNTPNKKGKITIHYKFEDSFIAVVIEDNGIGINKSLENKSIDKIQHKSLATKISKERLANLFKTRMSKIEIEITDLSHISPSLTGTRVRFRIPFRHLY